MSVANSFKKFLYWEKHICSYIRSYKFICIWNIGKSRVIQNEP